MPKEKETGKEKNKITYIDGNAELPQRKMLKRSERRELKILMNGVGYKKMSDEKRREILPKLTELAISNVKRREDEKIFARNVAIAKRHDKQVNKKTRRKLYTFLVTASIMLILVGYVLYAYVLVIADIGVVGTARYSAKDIISVSGLAEGDKLFSPSINADKIEEDIVRYFPYIKSVELKRSLPDTVTLSLTEEEPVFISEIFGQWVLVSAELRVLELSEEKPSGDFIRLKLPQMKSAVAGEPLTFRDDMFGVAQKAAEAVLSPAVAGEVTVLDISDRFSIYISYMGRYKLMIGDITDVELKISLANEIIKDEIFEGGNKGTIYLDNVNTPSVIIDNELNLD